MTLGQSVAVSVQAFTGSKLHSVVTGEITELWYDIWRNIIYNLCWI